MSPASRRAIPPAIEIALTVEQLGHMQTALVEAIASARARAAATRKISRRLARGHEVNGYPSGERGRLVAVEEADNDAQAVKAWASLLREIGRARAVL
jgi:hypothetical protein